jgi:hypothetical protein
MTDDQSTSKPVAGGGWWDRFLSWLDAFAEGSRDTEMDEMRNRVEALERRLVSTERQPDR